jgi:hypothetical protein
MMLRALTRRERGWSLGEDGEDCARCRWILCARIKPMLQFMHCYSNYCSSFKKEVYIIVVQFHFDMN